MSCAAAGSEDLLTTSRRHCGSHICNCGFFVTITAPRIPFRISFLIVECMEPSLTFGTAPISSSGCCCCPKLYRIMVPLCYDFASVRRNNAPPRNYPKALPSISSSSPDVGRSTFYFRGDSIFPARLFPNSVLRRKKNEEILHELGSPLLFPVYGGFRLN